MLGPKTVGHTNMQRRHTDNAEQQRLQNLALCWGKLAVAFRGVGVFQGREWRDPARGGCAFVSRRWVHVYFVGGIDLLREGPWLRVLGV